MSEPTNGEPPEGVPLDAPSYADALAELEEILTALEADRVDVDTLADRVERAATLIRLCRARLGAARGHVQAVVEHLDDEVADELG